MNGEGLWKDLEFSLGYVEPASIRPAGRDGGDGRHSYEPCH